MAFKWIQYLQLAEILDENESEAAKRAAVSRAYYAAFCICRNFARDKKELIPSNTADDHSLVIQHFRTSSDPKRIRIGSLLRRLRDNRNSADYDDELIAFPDVMAKESLKSANEILDLIKIL